MEKTEPVQKTTLRLPAKLWRECRVKALQQGTTMQAFLIDALKAHLQGKPAKEPRSS